MIGELPVLLFVLPYPDEFTPMSIWMSPSAARFAWGKINCQLLLNCGYWLFAKLEIWMLSASHRLAMNEISARVFVIVVVPKTGQAAARFAWGKINCQLLLNCGYWLFAKLEIWMLSASSLAN